MYGWTRNRAVLSELGTVQLEFRRLSQITGNNWYNKKVTDIMDKMENQADSNGLFPIYVNVNTGRVEGGKVTFGALGDSFYEYLLKQWVMSGKKGKKLL